MTRSDIETFSVHTPPGQPLTRALRDHHGPIEALLHADLADGQVVRCTPKVIPSSKRHRTARILVSGPTGAEVHLEALRRGKESFQRETTINLGDSPAILVKWPLASATRAIRVAVKASQGGGKVALIAQGHRED